MDVVERPALDGARVEQTDGAFAGFVRTGTVLEMKAFTGVTGDAGGYAVPREVDGEIARVLKGISPIRAIANVVTVGSAGYRKLITASPVFAELVPPMGELYANPSASQAMLDDAAFDVEAWLAGEIATEFARAEGAAFVGGNGVNRPKGFLTAPVSTAKDATRALGTLQYLPSGAAEDFGTAPDERLLDLVHSLRAPYRQGASFVMNANTLARIRKFKTADGMPLWQPSLAAGQPATLLGYPVVEAEDMPDIAANALSIAFGNFQAGYLIAERGETAILRDPYSNKPFVSFYATKRVGGCVADSAAIKLMKIATA
jgi:HK97 family phage major capsid protein